MACGAVEQIGPAELLVTEVVANAVRHGSGKQLDMSIAVDDAAIRVEVADGGDAPVAPRVPASADEPGGRGLMIVEALATRWGYDDAAGAGKTVWFELDRPT